MEPIALRKTAAITAVSTGTYDQIVKRRPALESVPRAEIPVGGELGDFTYLRQHARPNSYFDPTDARMKV